MSAQDFDVIIAGAGIAGLLIASELSKKHSVLLLERTNRIPQNKYWLTKSDCIAANEDLKGCTDRHYEYMDFIAYDTTSFRCTGDYVLWNTDSLVTHLQNKIIANQGVIRHDHRFYSYYYSADRIVVLANSTPYSSKLLIDSMGHSSPIVQAKGIVGVSGYYVLFGGLLELEQEAPPIGLCNVIVNSKPNYLEIFPTASKEAYTILIAPERSLKPTTDLQRDFNFIVRDSIYSKYFRKKAVAKNGLYGIVPVGKLNKRALNRIYFFGEAGQMNPGATATCLTKLLYIYREVAQNISERILVDKLDENDLHFETNHLDDFNRRFHLNLFNEILEWNSDDFLKLVVCMKNMDAQIVNQIIFGELNLFTAIRMKSLANLAKNKNFYVLKPLLKSLISLS